MKQLSTIDSTIGYGRLFSIVMLGSLAFSCKLANRSEPQKPNVLIILTDDLGYGDISCFGQEKYITPNIDKLAEEGVRCSDFYCPTPYSAPSRATLLTGRFPLRHGLTNNPTPDAGIDDVGISQDEITLGEVLQNAGYTTKLIGKWHLGHKEEFFPVNHGFDEYYGILYSNDMRPVQHIENRDTVEYPIDQNSLTVRYTEKAIDFITRNKEKPFFLHLCHPMPHKPLAVSNRFYTPETKDDLYGDVIRELDWSVGEIVSTLDELGILDNTIVIFMSDNGPWFGGSTGGLKGMKATSWEGGVRVPFILRYPKAFNPVTIDVPCWSPDIFPTLLNLTGANPNALNQLDGIDITNILRGEQKEHPPVFSLIDKRIMSVRMGRYKLFMDRPRYKRLPSDWVDPRRPDGETIIAPFEQATPDQYPGVVPGESVNKIQLFDLVNDKTESHDLSHTMPAKVDEMIKAYEKFKASLVLR
ncbi:MAG: sulfatase-like hydrolase/transferase [Bacteroidales bacterium]|nr:sulfatase-like hydrolase/transferase [Bacteroidales bacterium]